MSARSGPVLAAISKGELPGPLERSREDHEAVSVLGVLGFITWSGHGWDITQTGRDALRNYLASQSSDEAQPDSERRPPHCPGCGAVSQEIHAAKLAAGYVAPCTHPWHQVKMARDYIERTYGGQPADEAPLVTRSGKVLTEAELDSYAAEAEAGYDVSQLEKKLALIGREYMLIRKLARQLLKNGTAGHTATDLSDYGEGGRGFHFDVMLHEGGKPTGRVARVQVTLDRVEQVPPEGKQP